MGRIMAALYNRFMRGPEQACLGAWRAELLADAGGRVLEIGAGTGASLPYYPAEVTHLVAAEPDRHMRRQLLAAARDLSARDAIRFELEPSECRADSLSFADASFDTVVSTLVLCSVDSLDSSLSEILRVLVPGGKLLFLEHVAAETNPERLAWQRRVEPVWKRVAGGCHLTRRTEHAIERAGFEIQDITRESIHKAMAIARPSVRGVAIRPG